MTSNPVPFDPYVRRARIDRVVDGDTIDVWIDLGFRMQTHQRLRLAGIDTPEMRAKTESERDRARAATDFVVKWAHVTPIDLADDSEFPLAVRTEKTGKYGRWIAHVWRYDDPVSLTDALITAGHEK